MEARIITIATTTINSIRVKPFISYPLGLLVHFGVTGGDRTHDYRDHNAEFYQLNYGHTKMYLLEQVAGLEPVAVDLEGRRATINTIPAALFKHHPAYGIEFLQDYRGLCP